jgi:Ran GTPase-activating protein (RanGAP) involved in mRNA processing and transport
LASFAPFLQVLSAILPSLSMLKQLHLTFNHLQASAVKQIAFELPRLEHMEKLFLSYNSLGEEGGEALAKSLTCLTKLTILHLKNCSLRGAGVKSIANALQHLTRMRRLAIENNGIFAREEHVYQSLAAALRKCNSLELLNVGHALEPHDVAVLFDAIRSSEASGDRAVTCKVDNDQVTCFKRFRSLFASV